MLNIILYLIATFCVYCVVMYTIHRIMYHSTEEQAVKAVKDLIKEGIQYLRDSTIVSREQEPVPDSVLCNELLDTLDTVNKQSKDFTPWFFDAVSNGFPTIRYDIVASTSADFNLLCLQLQKTTLHHLEYNKYINPLVYAYVEKYGDNEYYVFVCYAVFGIAKEHLSALIKNRARVNKIDAIRKEAPVINEQLERELAEMKELEDMKNGFI